jgi:hypothetical protein
MKILLQSEAQTISNEELANNQKYLIDLLTRISHFRLSPPQNHPSSSQL